MSNSLSPFLLGDNSCATYFKVGSEVNQCVAICFSCECGNTWAETPTSVALRVTCLISTSPGCFFTVHITDKYQVNAMYDSVL